MKPVLLMLPWGNHESTARLDHQLPNARPVLLLGTLLFLASPERQTMQHRDARKWHGTRVECLLACGFS
eukprot:4560963-Alexandrium_andersonii.AAC.1